MFTVRSSWRRLLRRPLSDDAKARAEEERLRWINHLRRQSPSRVQEQIITEGDKQFIIQDIDLTADDDDEADEQSNPILPQSAHENSPDTVFDIDLNDHIHISSTPLPPNLPEDPHRLPPRPRHRPHPLVASPPRPHTPHRPSNRPPTPPPVPLPAPRSRRNLRVAKHLTHALLAATSSPPFCERYPSFHVAAVTPKDAGATAFRAQWSVAPGARAPTGRELRALVDGVVRGWASKRAPSVVWAREETDSERDHVMEDLFRRIREE